MKRITWSHPVTLGLLFELGGAACRMGNCTNNERQHKPNGLDERGLDVAVKSTPVRICVVVY